MRTIYCLMGKSGTGKDTIAKILAKNYNLIPLVPYTTRPKRPNETEGVEYHFITNDQFEEFKKEGKVIEYRQYPHYVDGNVIYSTIDDVNNNFDYLLITVPEAFPLIKGYFQAKNYNCKDIYLDVDPIERLERCFKRELETNGNKYQELIRRFLADEKDYSDISAYGIKNVIKNNDIDNAIKKIEDVINSNL